MTRRLSLTAAAALGALLLSPLARAQDASSGQAALSTEQVQLGTEVAQAIGIQTVADAAVKALRVVLVESIAADNKLPAEKVAPIVDQILVPDLQAREPEFVGAVGALYARAFTVAEMQQILAFYQTPVGQKLEGLQPELSHEMVAAGHAWIGRAGEAVLKADAGRLAAQGLKID